MQETGYAKINLALHVRGRMADGYHRIETAFVFAEHGDILEAAAADALSLDVTGPFATALAAEEDNLVLRAARALRERYGVSEGARLTLDKRLPVAAGIGGGSADAAAALRLLERFWRIDADEPALADIAAGLGADIPACLASRPVRGEGRGDELKPLDEPDLASKPLLLVNPGVPLATADVFAAWDGLDRGPLSYWRAGRNDLEPAARSLVPEIGEALAALGDAEASRLSGSGATCFGLYPGDAELDAAAARIAAAHPSWWVVATRLR